MFFKITKSMNYNYRKFPKFSTYTCVALFGTSIGWIYHQVRKTQQILEETVDTSVMNVDAMIPHEEIKTDEFLEIDTFYPYEQATLTKSVWDTLKFAYARRLVRLANSDDQMFRIKAVKHLAKVKNLDQWHCSLLANMMDPRTAVGLARTDKVDRRLFIDPPLRYHNYSRDMLVNVMREFLIGLYEISQHPCLGYFLSQVFVYEHLWLMDSLEEKDNSHIVDYDSSALELSKFIQSEDDVMPKCLESLLHHSSIEKYTRDIVKLNGLPLLMEIHNRYKNNLNMTIKICQILSFMSFDKSILKPLHKSGWIGILSEWVKHEDVRVSIPAARALANLDSDCDCRYSRRLYILHPARRAQKEPEVDVVFIHGLLGGVFYTWRQRNKSQNALSIIGKNKKKESLIPDGNVQFQSGGKAGVGFFRDLKERYETEELCKEYEIVWDDIPLNTNDYGQGPFTCTGNKNLKEEKCYSNCWPRDWLPEDCKDLRIIGINYDTSLSMWASICPAEKVKFTLAERSEDLLERLQEAGLGKKPIVWVTHSMGGLIVKNILCNAFESQNPKTRDVCLNTKAIVFYSTPHNGSRLANLSQATALLLWPSVEVRELRENSPQLKKIHEKFLQIIKEVPMKVVTFVETKSTVVTAMKFNFLLVAPNSGNPGVGEYYEVPQDHLGICKPITKNSFLYQKVVHVIRKVIEENKL